MNLGVLLLVVGIIAVIILSRRDTVVRPGSVPLDPSTASVEDYLAAGRKIDAIKLYRAQHGVGLKEAKHAVEAMARGLPQR